MTPRPKTADPAATGMDRSDGNDDQRDARGIIAARAALQDLAAGSREVSITRLLRDEPARGQRLVLDAAGVHVDLSRHRLPLPALDALLRLAEAIDIEGQRNAMFAGEAVNFTEGRPAWHVALRRPAGTATDTDAAAVEATLARVCAFADTVRAGRWPGASGHPIRSVVHVGIGGSHLGPQLACEALADRDAPLTVRFLSNVDPDSCARATAGLDPHTTLAIIASKSWRTAETARNARALRRWFVDGGVPSDGLHRHLAGVTSNLEAALGSGLTRDAVFPLWDWVGGRYSMWSSVGLPIVLAVGAARFRAMLAGAHEMDRHFREAPLAANAPVLMALVSWWNRLVLDGGTEVVVPYSDRLRSLVAFLQQLQMESNGKHVDHTGRMVPWQTTPVIWGSTGTDAQHSFFQALHQGTSVHPVEFVLVVPPSDDDEGRGRTLLANALGQIEALTIGRHVDTRRQADAGAMAVEDTDTLIAAHRHAPGNRPSTVLLLDALDAQRFGALIALYEHKTATLGWLWEIDSFDQWGVELGKTLADAIEPLLAPGITDPAQADPAGADPVTADACDRSNAEDAHPVVLPLIRRLRTALDARNRRSAGPPAA